MMQGGTMQGENICQRSILPVSSRNWFYSIVGPLREIGSIVDKLNDLGQAGKNSTFRRA